MHNRTAAAIAAGILLTLTACGGSSTEDKPTTPASTAAASSTVDPAQATKECVDAVAATIGARPDDFDPENDSDPKPDACKSLSEDEYLDAYMDGLSEANKQGLADLQDQIDEATERQ
ncbi:hypothetical protein ACFVDT_06995 [Streptomyces sp. NPDC057699]|uniref:hypothetical protein n=1 Tax=Streptomyces sp. NPDC057699 TaxID=3346220 RepID=UPI0036C50442